MFEKLLVSHLNLLGGILLTFVFYQIFRVYTSPSSQVPGPWHTRWTRAAYVYHWLRGDNHVYIHSLHEQYGPTVRYAPNLIATSELESVKAIYTIKETFRKSKWYRDVSASPVHSIFNTDNIEIHRRHRRLLASPMSESSLKAVIPEVCNRVTMVIDKMEEEMQSRGAADVYKWFFFMTTDTIGELSFGDSFHMLELGKENLQKNEYAEDLQQAAASSAIRVMFPRIVDTLGYLRLPKFNDIRKRIDRLKGYAITSIERYENLVKADLKNAPHTIFSKMFQAGADDKMTIGEVTISAQSLIIAGSDTTANTLTYLTWEVCRNPDIKRKLLEELSRLPEDYNESHLRELSYLDHVIDETLRVHSIVPGVLPRVVPPEGANIGGYWLNGGTGVAAQAYTMHRNEDIFPGPYTFNPMRWENTTKAMKESFMPFGRGSRNCIGMHLALIEIRLAVARFFLRFPDAKVSSLEGMSDEDMMTKTFFLLSPAGDRCLIQAH